MFLRLCFLLLALSACLTVVTMRSMPRASKSSLKVSTLLARTVIKADRSRVSQSPLM